MVIMGGIARSWAGARRDALHPHQEGALDYRALDDLHGGSCSCECDLLPGGLVGTARRLGAPGDAAAGNRAARARSRPAGRRRRQPPVRRWSCARSSDRTAPGRPRCSPDLGPAGADVGPRPFRGDTSPARCSGALPARHLAHLPDHSIFPSSPCWRTSACRPAQDRRQFRLSRPPRPRGQRAARGARAPSARPRRSHDELAHAAAR